MLIFWSYSNPKTNNFLENSKAKWYFLENFQFLKKAACIFRMEEAHNISG